MPDSQQDTPELPMALPHVPIPVQFGCIGKAQLYQEMIHPDDYPEDGDRCFFGW